MLPPDSFRPLDPSDFSFHGFDNLMTPVAQVLREIGIRKDEPTVSIIEDGTFVPSTKVPTADPSQGRSTFQGGIVTRDGESIDLVQLRRRGTRWGTRVLGGVPEPVAIKPARRIEEEAVYLGWYFDQFGHFLLESLARIWYLNEVHPSVKVVFHTRRHPPATGITRRILEAFGVPQDRILVLDEPTLLRRVIVPEPLYEISTMAHERMPEPFRRVASRVVGDAQPSGQPVYLSRRLLPSKLRQIVGEDDLEEVLRENGFLIAHPETMAFEDQLRLLNRHSEIFTSAGSAVHGVLFALGKPTFHILTDGIPRQDYFLAPKVAAAAASYVNCLERGDRRFVDNRSPLLAETPKLVEYLDAQGFLKKRLRASLVGRHGGKRDEYDEAWFYASVQDVLPHGEALPTEVEREALLRAQSSWPLSWILARYYTAVDSSRVDQLARQFAELAATETDLGRLAHYAEDVEGMASRVIKRCGPATAAHLAEVLSDRFAIEPAGRRGSRKRAIDQRP